MIVTILYIKSPELYSWKFFLFEQHLPISLPSWQHSLNWTASILQKFYHVLVTGQSDKDESYTNTHNLRKKKDFVIGNVSRSCLRYSRYVMFQHCSWWHKLALASLCLWLCIYQFFQRHVFKNWQAVEESVIQGVKKMTFTWIKF